MKNILITAIILILSINFSFSQKKEKQVNFYNNVKFGKQHGIFISTVNGISKFNYAKLGLTIDNESDDYIFFNKSKCKFVINNNSYFPKTEKKGKIIKPNRKRTFTVKVAKETNYLVDKFSFRPQGISKFSAKGKLVKVGPFQLPAKKNTIEAGPFKINMLKLKKETQETVVKFECTYTGDKIAVITPSNCVLRTNDGKEWANSKSKEKVIILQKNERKKFNVIFQIPAKSTDMQFAEMNILWKNTFSESELKKVDFDVQTITKDSLKSK